MKCPHLTNTDDCDHATEGKDNAILCDNECVIELSQRVKRLERALKPVLSVETDVGGYIWDAMLNQCRDAVIKAQSIMKECK